MKLGKILPFVVGFLPMIALAQGFSNIESAFQTVIRLLNSYVIPLIIGIAVIYFLIGIVKYISNQGDETARKEARNMMIYGIIGIFVMVSVWGLVNVLGQTLGLDNSIPTDLPQVPEVR